MLESRIHPRKARSSADGTIAECTVTDLTRRLAPAKASALDDSLVSYGGNENRRSSCVGMRNRPWLCSGPRRTNAGNLSGCDGAAARFHGNLQRRQIRVRGARTHRFSADFSCRRSSTTRGISRSTGQRSRPLTRRRSSTAPFVIFCLSNVLKNS